MKKQNEKITTMKLQNETKNRLEKLREHKRETYDDIIRKILYVLNAVRESPEKAKHILEFIDEKRKRMIQEQQEQQQQQKEQEIKNQENLNEIKNQKETKNNKTKK